ncbi:hypothetical protein [Nocardia veterana]|uniref:Uncharacterized protein n=1 Tax=Nocardia veterana TaxID=132249 RepID=A0A7X6M118_9NOCA|nr:hypothetical protein [Nocardia veterana]NKY88232.1 hypothetical protein [Nocardia veterana]
MDTIAERFNYQVSLGRDDPNILGAAVLIRESDPVGEAEISAIGGVLGIADVTIGQDRGDHRRDVLGPVRSRRRAACAPSR